MIYIYAIYICYIYDIYIWYIYIYDIYIYMIYIYMIYIYIYDIYIYIYDIYIYDIYIYIWYIYIWYIYIWYIYSIYPQFYRIYSISEDIPYNPYIYIHILLGDLGGITWYNPLSKLISPPSRASRHVWSASHRRFRSPRTRRRAAPGAERWDQSSAAGQARPDTTPPGWEFGRSALENGLISGSMFI